MSPQTAKRVGDELVAAREATRIRHRPTRTVRYELTRSGVQRVRDELGRLPLRDREDQLAFLGSTDAPVWVLGPGDYPVPQEIPEFVALPRSWLHLVPHPRPYVVFESARPLEVARDELPDSELLIALLKLAEGSSGPARGRFAAAARRLYLDWVRTAHEREGFLRRVRQERLVATARGAGISVP